ncbi:integral membrane protein [Rutstroemia sp. NJR-2017a BVV2]|nr:integral membrane protein [Rutstroemia sp. NJR-2017a BVV2]
MNDTTISLENSTEDRAPLLLISTWTWTAFALLFVALRFYCRLRLIRSTWWDDWLILAAVASTTAMSVIWTIYANGGGCRHAASLTPTQRVNAGRLNWISQPLCVSGLTTCKISVACLILRLQSPTPWRTRLLVVLCTIMVLTNITVVVIMFTQCTPVRLLWDPESAPNGHCIPSNISSTMSQSASSECLIFIDTKDYSDRSLGYMAFIDLALAALPVHMIWKLQIKKSKKIAIGVLLSTGVSAFGFAIVKIVELANDANRTDFTCELSHIHTLSALMLDIGATVWLFVWNAFEINLIIIAACIPTLVPLFEIVWNHRSTTYFSSRHRPTADGDSFPKQSFRMRHRLGSVKSDAESGKDILGVKTSIHGDSEELRAPRDVQNEIWQTDTTNRIVSSGKIAITTQWSVVERT